VSDTSVEISASKDELPFAPTSPLPGASPSPPPFRDGGEAGGFSGATGVAFGKVYANTFTGPPFIFALDATNGAVDWQCLDTECNVFGFGPAGIAAGAFLVGDSSAQLRAFDAATGALLRTLDLGGQISSGPAVVNDMVFVGVGVGFFSPAGESQGVYGLALQNGHTAARTKRALARSSTHLP
jgi:outer membrane protein assembly factor BamB